MSFLDGFAVDDNHRFSVLERLVNNQFFLARASRPLDYNERISSLHEPGSNLFDVSFPVIPDGIEPCIISPLLPYSQDIVGSVCLSREPFVDLVVSDMERVGNMSFDEERSYPKSFALALQIREQVVHIRIENRNCESRDKCC